MNDQMPKKDLPPSDDWWLSDEWLVDWQADQRVKSQKLLFPYTVPYDQVQTNGLSSWNQWELNKDQRAIPESFTWSAVLESGGLRVNYPEDDELHVLTVF